MQIQVLGIMAHHFPEDYQYGEYAAGQYNQQMEERFVEALDFHIQDSVNKALVKALRPFAQPIFNYGLRRFRVGSGNPTPVEVNINEPDQSQSDPFKQTISSVLNDHEYLASQDKGTASLL
ncbi:hypothetical protein NDU88_005498 [Pleurodeles waltl]|uniref:Uncharacterized protein n=1 Tax=Pleurodeles waltl TaxID=8319 RepID=A0AAV7TVI7_PLEWA|nr:hypothetical protein NDU88_005498 [Pleurodeles waltl]